MNAVVQVNTSAMSRSEWLKCRTTGIGGSDASVIAGINPYRSAYQLWLEKTGQVEPAETYSEVTHFGTILEPIVKQEFTARTGLNIYEPKALYRSCEYPFMLADLDGIVSVDGEPCVFEAKTASAYKQSEWEEGIPPEYMMQIQHYMAVTGFRKSYIAALIGGNHFIYREVSRDDEMIRDIIRMEERFWTENVLGGIEPVLDGSKATSEYLDEKYSESDGKSIDLPHEMLDLCENIEMLTAKIGELETEKNAAVNRIKGFMKEAETGHIGNHKVTWKSVSSWRLDSKKLKADHPDIYREYVKQTSYRRFALT